MSVVMFTNGQFYNKSGASFDSLLVEDGVAIKTGDSETMEIPEGVDVVDFKGNNVYPGFIDNHLHMLSYCWKKLYEVDLSTVTSGEMLVEKVRNFIQSKEIQPGTFVVGSGWNQEYFGDKALPDRYLLDQISIVHPIILNRACYHLCVVNSMALNMADITSETDQVERGAIDKDPNGVPTGILRENAESLVWDLYKGLTHKEVMKELIIEGCQDLAKVGITTVHTDDFAFVESKHNLLAAFMELDEVGLLPIKVVLQLRAEEVQDVLNYKAMGLKSGLCYKNLSIGPIKIIADGSLGSRTAALEESYSDEADNRGLLTVLPEVLDQMVEASVNNDFDIAIHAIGDRTMNLILDSYEKHQAIIREKGIISSIIHCQIGSDAILNRFHNLDVIANIQPIFLNTDWHMAEERVGSKRLLYSYCWKKYRGAGVQCVASSDAPIESFNPLYGIYASVTRKDLTGQPISGWLPEEKLTIEESIDLFTSDGSKPQYGDQDNDPIWIGKEANFVVLTDDIEQIDEDRIKDVGIMQTYVRGKLVYDSGTD